MTLIATEAAIALADPGALASRLIEHLVEHEVVFETRDGRTIADLGKGTGTLTVTANALNVRVEAGDRGDLEMLRSVFASHILEFAQEPIDLRWSGLDAATTAFANFREIRLVGAQDLTPHMRRLTFAGEDLARFASTADLHVRLYFPPPGLAAPEWPRPGPDGCTLWPPDERRPQMRYYTIRRVDPARGSLDIDFVLHTDDGPGAAFARDGRPGDIIGMVGPIGRTIGAAAWHLVAGDETALPAIARIAEGLPPDAKGSVLVEVAGPEDEQALTVPPGVGLRWLHRGQAPGALAEAVRAQAWPDHDDVFVWIGCEFAEAKALRRHIERERGLPRDRHLIVGYWSRDEDDAHD